MVQNLCVLPSIYRAFLSKVWNSMCSRKSHRASLVWAASRNMSVKYGFKGQIRRSGHTGGISIDGLLRSKKAIFVCPFIRLKNSCELDQRGVTFLLVCVARTYTNLEKITTYILVQKPYKIWVCFIISLKTCLQESFGFPSVFCCLELCVLLDTPQQSRISINGSSHILHEWKKCRLKLVIMLSIKWIRFIFGCC